MRFKPVSRTLGIAALALAAGIAVSSSEAQPTAKTPTAKDLPFLTESQIKVQMRDLVRRMGDLSVYVSAVEADGTIVLTHVKLLPQDQAKDAGVPQHHHDSCSTTTIKPTIAGQAVAGEALSRATQAVETLNADVVQHKEVVFKLAIRADTC